MNSIFIWQILDHDLSVKAIFLKIRREIIIIIFFTRINRHYELTKFKKSLWSANYFIFVCVFFIKIYIIFLLKDLNYPFFKWLNIMFIVSSNTLYPFITLILNEEIFIIQNFKKIITINQAAATSILILYY